MIIHKKLIVPDEQELYILGDIHGDYDAFKAMLKLIGAQPNDYIISTGDLIDRGAGIAPLLFDFLHKPNYHAVIGNHEEMMIHVDKPYNRDLWLHMGNGGDKTLEQLGWEGVKYFTEKILKKFPLILEIHHRNKVFGVIHAGVPLFYENTKTWKDIITLAKKDEDYRNQLLEDRDLIRRLQRMRQGTTQEQQEALNQFEAIQGIDYVIHGHTGVVEPFIHHNMIWLDTMFLARTFTVLNFNEKTQQINFLINE